MNEQATSSTPGQIQHRVDLAYSNLGFGVMVSLGKWRGRGDWAAFSAEGKRRAALHALTELDQVIADLTVARDDLSAALTAGADLPAEG